MWELMFVACPHELYQVFSDWQRGYRLRVSSRCNLSVLSKVFRDEDLQFLVLR
jgi:hypothetical protein